MGHLTTDEYSNNVGEIGCEVDDEISDNGEGSEFDEEFDMSSGDGNEPRDCDAERISINCMADICKIDMNNISADEVERYDFADLEIAYQFYFWYGRATGFSVRKSHVVRDHAGEILQQTFLCSRAGYRENRGLTPEKRKREPKNQTRCGCEAKFRVHIDIVTRRWYVKIFEFDHNHVLLDGMMCGLLPAHRKMMKTDVQDIESHGIVGIRPYQMYGAMANSAGGFHKVGFVKKDLYNQVSRQRKLITSDASAAVKYLRDLGKKDQLMFVTHSVDKDNRLERLFWCDGESRMNFEVFGDVLAFDATYRKNKYNCPFVVFSGVNHHNQTIVFATGLVTRETEETYVWLLEQFVCAMKGKTPISVYKSKVLAP
ncbi:hypothetical protein TSUD_282940 [Trifolium subterraneum]|uniref:Uncharacterized protein n=1 Tax=Trifolium subterraneum TaxID=3900 RepID=A0A2Z6PEJ1_TRISU|nr:hypothetical protein TSUD_282940 [Trifolium subterraneum]